MIVAEALPIAGAANRPAKYRQIIKDPIVLEKPAPSVNAANSGLEIKKTIFRPNVSQQGAAMRGPKARPSVYSDKGRMATSSETSNSSTIPGIPGPMMAAPRAVTKARHMIATVDATRRNREKFCRAVSEH